MQISELAGKKILILNQDLDQEIIKKITLGAENVLVIDDIEELLVIAFEDFDHLLCEYNIANEETIKIITHLNSVKNIPRDFLVKFSDVDEIEESRKQPERVIEQAQIDNMMNVIGANFDKIFTGNKSKKKLYAYFSESNSFDYEKAGIVEVNESKVVFTSSIELEKCSEISVYLGTFSDVEVSLEGELETLEYASESLNMFSYAFHIKECNSEDFETYCKLVKRENDVYDDIVQTINSAIDI